MLRTATYTYDRCIHSNRVSNSFVILNLISIKALVPQHFRSVYSNYMHQVEIFFLRMTDLYILELFHNFQRFY